MRLRDATAADLDALLAVFFAAVRVAARRDYTAAQVRAWAPDAPDRAAWTARLAGQSVWIAEIDGESAGFAVLGAAGHLDMLFVHPGFARRGVAAALLHHAEEAARGRGCARLFTEASLTARPVFLKHGYRDLGAQTVHLRGQAFVNHRMEKPLA